MKTKTKKINIVLVGNPNVGKSVIFNYLTGVYADVSNYPGTTIEIAKSQLKLKHQDLDDFDIQIIDSPGVYGISSFNDEEKATRDYVLNADLIINVISSLTLSRDLFLTKQLCDFGKPMIVLLNQTDEAKLHKVTINSKILNQELGIDFIETVATEGLGLDILGTNYRTNYQRQRFTISIQSRKSFTTNRYLYNALYRVSTQS
jgi:ferrous iron transport protein B